jgi:16S rRNA (guanine527-N7)-methyltransferase
MIPLLPPPPLPRKAKNSRGMSFQSELEEVLPPGLPGREVLVAKAARHLELLVEMNQFLNLTRVTEPHEAAIKHVLDSVNPWRLFEGARRVLDAGTGPGFPGIPLALLLPETHFTLAESTGKKARFVESAAQQLELRNVTVEARRAEELARDGGFDVITARAMAPLEKALGLFAPALKKGTRALFYKGPDVDREIAEAAKQAQKLHVSLRVAMRYELPGGFGARTIVEVSVETGRH